MKRDILVTGGTGKTGRRIVEHLRAKGETVRIASRSDRGSGTVRFDWHDAATFDPAFERIGAVYLVAPSGDPDPFTAMRMGIDRALALDVRRFVLLSASSLEEGGPMMGEVHAYLRRHAPEWVVLQPTWFMQNLSEQQHMPTIRDEDSIYSATGEGRVAFIDAADIAAVAAAALTEPGFPSGPVVLTGPEALSYDDVAMKLSTILGRPIRHRRLSESDMAQRFRDQGLPEQYALLLAAMDVRIGRGSEDQVTDVVDRITGGPPTPFARFATDHRAVWSRTPV